MTYGERVRKLDGHNYHYSARYFERRDAEQCAKSIRSLGSLARVIHTKTPFYPPDAYDVWELVQ